MKGTGLNSRTILAGACSVPAILVAITGAWGAVVNPRGGWIWPPDQVNASEAVATGNYAELVRLLELGDDPNRSHPVQAPFLSSEPVVATPLEAAVRGGQATMLELLLERGAVMTPGLAGRLKCLNEGRNNPEVEAILDRFVQGAPACPPESP